MRRQSRQLRQDAGLEGTTVSTTWSSVPGKAYQVQFSLDLITWADLGFRFDAEAAPATETSSGSFNLAGIGAPAKAYFRIVIAE